MRAFALKEFGDSGSVVDIPTPEPEAGQVRVRVEGAGVNPADIGMIKGFYKERMEHRFPLIPGIDLSGIVDAVGQGVTKWKKGDAVYGAHGKMYVGGGTMAEYVLAVEGTIAARPSSVGGVDAAALPLAGVSALQCIDALELKQGDVIVVMGAAGGIGSFATQLAKAAGAHVIGVSRAVNFEYVRGRGADETVDYATTDVFAAVKAAHPNGIAGVLGARADKPGLAHLAELVPNGGHVVSMLGAADVEALAARGIKAVNVFTKTATDPLERLARLLEAGTITLPEITEFPLDRAGKAFAEIEGAHVRGKLVVKP